MNNTGRVSCGRRAFLYSRYAAKARPGQAALRRRSIADRSSWRWAIDPVSPDGPPISSGLARLARRFDAHIPVHGDPIQIADRLAYYEPAGPAQFSIPTTRAGLPRRADPLNPWFDRSGVRLRRLAQVANHVRSHPTDARSLSRSSIRTQDQRISGSTIATQEYRRDSRPTRSGATGRSGRATGASCISAHHRLVLPTFTRSAPTGAEVASPG